MTSGKGNLGLFLIFHYWVSHPDDDKVASRFRMDRATERQGFETKYSAGLTEKSSSAFVYDSL